MARSLVIALVVVAPFWFVLRRRMRRADEPAEADDRARSGHDEPALEDLVERIAELAAGSAEAGASVTVLVPRGLTIDGDPAPEPVVDAIVRDAIARSGLVPTAELDTAEGRMIECRPRATAAPG